MARWQTHNTDLNEPAIIEFLEACGASVVKIGRPVDLLVGYHGVTAAVEIKQPKKKSRSELQDKFFSEFRGFARVVRTLDEAKALLDDMHRKLCG